LPETTHVLEQLSQTFSAHGTAGHQGTMCGILKMMMMMVMMMMMMMMVVVVVVVMKIKMKL